MVSVQLMIDGSRGWNSASAGVIKLIPRCCPDVSRRRRNQPERAGVERDPQQGSTAGAARAVGRRDPAWPSRIAQLEEQFGVVWVRGTAGSGKTTAVLEAVESAQRDLAWLTLDSSEAAPGRLLIHLEAALTQTLPDLAPVATDALADGIAARRGRRPARRSGRRPRADARRRRAGAARDVRARALDARLLHPVRAADAARDPDLAPLDATAPRERARGRRRGPDHRGRTGVQRRGGGARAGGARPGADRRGHRGRGHGRVGRGRAVRGVALAGPHARVRRRGGPAQRLSRVGDHAQPQRRASSGS